jgi:RNA polymerase sigma-70 factor (ECF subfamily)
LQIVDWCCLPEDELTSSEVRAYIDSAVERLPERLRVVFLLRDIENLSTLEAAQALNLSEEAVKTRLSRARMRLREDLSTYFSERMGALATESRSMPEVKMEKNYGTPTR